MVNSSSSSCNLQFIGYTSSLRLVSFLLCLGLVVSIVPILSVEEFFVPALDRCSDDVSNTTVFFNLKLDNNGETTFYDVLNVTIYFGQNLGVPVGFVSIPEFMQEKSENIIHLEQRVATVGVPWEAATREVSNCRGTALFQAHLETVVRIQLSFIQRLIMVKTNVTVNDRGDTVKSFASVQVINSANMEEVAYAITTVCLAVVLIYMIWRKPEEYLAPRILQFTECFLLSCSCRILLFE